MTSNKRINDMKRREATAIGAGVVGAAGAAGGAAGQAAGNKIGNAVRRSNAAAADADWNRNSEAGKMGFRRTSIPRTIKGGKGKAALIGGGASAVGGGALMNAAHRRKHGVKKNDTTSAFGVEH